MALTVDILKADKTLAGLTDEQLAVITALSANDENSVIAKKTGEIYGGLDTDILAVSGINKNGSEKTFDYAKRVLNEFKTKVDESGEFKTKIEELSKEKARLEKAIQDGSTDSETAKALKQAKADLQGVTAQYNDLKSKYDGSIQEHANELFSIRVETALQTATAGLKFKAELPESATSVLLSQAINKIKSMNPEFIDDGKGGKTLAFKDDSGAILRNPGNKLEAYTPVELLTRELDTMGILDKGRKASGSGSRSNGSQSSGNSLVDVSGAKTRVEAYDVITSNLQQQGIQLGTAEFDAGMRQAWEDNNISALPEQ